MPEQYAACSVVRVFWMYPFTASQTGSSRPNFQNRFRSITSPTSPSSRDSPISSSSTISLLLIPHILSISLSLSRLSSFHEDAILSTDHAFAAYRVRRSCCGSPSSARHLLLLLLSCSSSSFLSLPAVGEKEGKNEGRERHGPAASSRRSGRGALGGGFFVGAAKLLAGFLGRYSRKVNLASSSMIATSYSPSPMRLSVDGTSVTISDVPRRASVPRKKLTALGRNVITACYRMPLLSDQP